MDPDFKTLNSCHQMTLLWIDGCGKGAQCLGPVSGGIRILTAVKVVDRVHPVFLWIDKRVYVSSMICGQLLKGIGRYLLWKKTAGLKEIYIPLPYKYATRIKTMSFSGLTEKIFLSGIPLGKLSAEPYFFSNREFQKAI